MEVIQKLLKAGKTVNEIRKETGFTTAIIYQEKRLIDKKLSSLGCIVCGQKIAARRLCPKHYYDYHFKEVIRKRNTIL